MAGLDDALLTSFIEGFFGYGNLNAPHWFIGMEEGGGDSLEEIQQRLETWHKRGRKTTEDLVAYHEAIGIDRFFGDKPALQSTWAKLIRVLHNLEGKSTNKNAIRQTQANAFGRSDGTSCLLELLPLPSPSTNKWLYGKHSNLSYLKNRSLYRQKVMPSRIEELQAMIERYRPRTVMFYGMNYRDQWESISRQILLDQDIEKFRTLNGANEHTIFAVTPHPIAHGITNAYFEEIGKLLIQQMRSL